MKPIQSLSIPALLFVTTLFFGVSCERDGSAENAGEEIDNKMEEAGDKIENAGDKIEDDIDDASN